MYYVYRHIRLDKNTPFYIGKGTTHKTRKDFNNYYHRAFSKYNRNNIWKRITAKTDYTVEIIFESESEKEVFEKEKEFIKLYGRIDNKTGILSNLTDGGDGDSGKIVSKETRERISKANKGRKYSKEVNAKKALKGELNPFYGKQHTDEMIRFYQVSQSTKIKIITPNDEVIIFECIRDCAKYFNKTKDVMRTMINKINKGYKVTENSFLYNYKISRIYE